MRKSLCWGEKKKMLLLIGVKYHTHILVLSFISDSDSGISLHSNWCLELVNRPRDTKGKGCASPVCSLPHSLAWQLSAVVS